MDMLQITPAFSIFSTLVIVVCGLVYLISKIRQNDMKILREANIDLRSSKDDQDQKIAGLQQAVHTLEGKVDILEKRNKTLEDLVVVALKQYFFENPSMASTISATMGNVAS